MHLMARVCSKFRTNAAIAEAFTGVGRGKRSVGRFVENLPPVVGANSLQDPFQGEAFRCGGMNVQLRGHLRGGEPARFPEMLRQGVDSVGSSHAAHSDRGEGPARARTQPTSVEGPSNLSIGLLRGQSPDQFDHASRCPPQIRSFQR